MKLFLLTLLLSLHVHGLCPGGLMLFEKEYFKVKGKSDNKGMCYYHSEQMKAEQEKELEKKNLKFATRPNSPEYGFHISGTKELKDTHATVRYVLTDPENKNINIDSCSTEWVKAYFTKISGNPQVFYMLVKNPDLDTVKVKHVNESMGRPIEMLKYRNEVRQVFMAQISDQQERFDECMTNVEKLIQDDLKRIKHTVGQKVYKYMLTMPVQKSTKQQLKYVKKIKKELLRATNENEYLSNY